MGLPGEGESGDGGGGGMFEEDYGFSWRSVNPLTKLVELYFLFSQSILKNSVSFAF